MRVLHVIPSLSPAHGGPTVALRSMETALVACGVEVETVTTDDDGDGRRLARPLGLPLLEGGVQRRYFAKRTDFYRVAPSLGTWLRRNVSAFDVVHVHALFSYASVAACYTARREGTPYIIRPLGTLAHYGMSHRRPLLKRLSLAWIEGPLLRDAAAVHFTSEAECEEAQSLGVPLRAAVIPLGVDSAKVGSAARLGESLPQIGNGPIVLYLSRLDPVKNLEALLSAFALLRSGGLRPALLIAGDGRKEYRLRLEGYATNQGVADQVHWLGEVRGERKADLLAAGDVFVLPSFSENFGIAAAEALMAGLPCVLGKGVAIADAVEAAGAGLAVDPTPQGIAAALKSYLVDPDRRASAGSAAKALAAREYSLDAMGRQLCELYAQIKRS